MYRGFSVAIIVPAYNEEELIEETLDGIPEYVDRIYVVNDGSTDRTAERVLGHSSADSRVILITHEANKGVGGAIVTGYARSWSDHMDISAVMAGDNQMDPAELPKLLDPIVNGEADYAKGNRLESRETAKQMSDWRFLGNIVLTYLTRIASGNRSLIDPQNGYTAISNQVFEKMKPESIFTWYGYCNDILVKLSTYGFAIKDVIIPARYGREKSKIRYPKYILRVSRLLLNEFIWRVNYQHLRPSQRKAHYIMAIGGSITATGWLGAAVLVVSPAGLNGTGSLGSVMAITGVIGLAITILANILKRRGAVRSDLPPPGVGNKQASQ